MRSLFLVLATLAVGAAMTLSPMPSAFAAERAVTAASSQSPHYELRYGYEHGGKWRAHWVLVK